MSDYKAFKEASVSGLTGSTVTHVNMVSSVALASIGLYSVLQTRVYRVRAIPFLVSWIVLLLPLLLSMTLSANKPGLLSFLLLLPTAFILFSTPAPDRMNMPLPAGKSPTPPPVTPSYVQSREVKLVLTPVPAVTTYRAHMMLMTILGILAVDFPVFPRELAKCESYGVSLMDLGIGSFVFSNGLVSAIPLLKNPAHLSAPLLPKSEYGSTKNRTHHRTWCGTRSVGQGHRLSSVFPVLSSPPALTEFYDQEHETEYGVHWNFFISLAILPILQTLLHPLIRVVPASVLGVGVGILHQLALVFGLEHYVRTAPRVDLISANKEGLASLAGYLSIHLLGLSVGTLILPPSPNFFRRLQTGRSTVTELGAPRQNDKGAIELASYAIVWWALLGLVSLLRIDEGVSRQTANLAYGLWIVAFNTSFILGYVVLDMFFFPVPTAPKKAKPSPTHILATSPARAPPLLEAISKNALPLFLLANLLTGVVNLSMQTMYANTIVSMSVLSLYAFAICGPSVAAAGNASMAALALRMATLCKTGRM
ncbi:GPI-anchored wall transfer protein [Mycena sanguinolenta]|uniref:GPI-anchored wall transfer protein n=1 Tax=Mycena sanguinolenta TaxID=230812 RepID=A0A8H6Z5P1_9AGAR|nr:GPI-anchored wall transfer protein [Mycena sanguinolenta]